MPATRIRTLDLSTTEGTEEPEGNTLVDTSDGPDVLCLFFFFQAEDGIRYLIVTGVQPCALPISGAGREAAGGSRGTTGRRCGAGIGVEGAGRARRGRRVTRARRECSTRRQPAGIDRDRKSVVEGKRVDLGGRRIIKKKKKHKHRP